MEHTTNGNSNYQDNIKVIKNIISEFTPEIYNDNSKFKSILAEYIVEDKKLLKILNILIDNNGAVDIYNYSNLKNSIFDLDVKKMIARISDDSLVPQEILADGVILLCQGLGKDFAYGNAQQTTETHSDFKIKDGVLTKYLGTDKIVIIPDSVTSIEGDIVFDEYEGKFYEGAFSNCSSLTSIIIPNSVTSIGDGSFNSCSSLTSIVIPNSVTSIGDGSFSYCTSLTSVTISDSVKSIKSGAFMGCISLTSITIPDSVTSIEGCKRYIDSNDNYIYEGAFSGCTSLTSITIPNSVLTIGEATFSNCSSLTNVIIPNSVLIIKKQAFKNCTSLKNITIPNSVLYIEGGIEYDREWGNIINYFYVGAFDGCSSLTSITIPDSITSIEKGTFMGCSSLTSIIIPNSVTSIEVGAFMDCSSLTSIVIPDSVTSIEGDIRCNYDEDDNGTSMTEIFELHNMGNYSPDSDDYYCSSYHFEGAFKGCTSLTSVTIPNSVISIGRGVFEGCTSLTSVIIPNSVTSIGSGAFKNCTSLISITILNSITHMECINLYTTDYTIYTVFSGTITYHSEKAFNGCSSLISMTIPKELDFDIQDCDGCHPRLKITKY